MLHPKINPAGRGSLWHKNMQVGPTREERGRHMRVSLQRSMEHREQILAALRQAGLSDIIPMVKEYSFWDSNCDRYRRRGMRETEWDGSNTFEQRRGLHLRRAYARRQRQFGETRRRRRLRLAHAARRRLNQ